MPKITFQDFSKLWLESYAKDNVKPSTLSGYNHTIEKRLIPAFGHLQMSDISTRAMQLYVADRRKNVCGKSILNEVVLLKTMFGYAYKWGYIKINPCEHLERPKTVKPEIDILEPAEISLLLDNSSDLDWNSIKLYIRRSVWRNQFQTPKSKSAIRKIDLPDTLIPELRKWKLACPLSEHDLMFPSQDGQITCHDNAMKRHFNQALRRAKLRHVSFHSLRHTNASIRIQAGQNIKYMSSELGHASVKITLDNYGHLFNDQDFNRRQVDMLETTFNTSDRNPLEKPLQNAEKGLAVVANPL
jgi:integrase